MEIARGISPVRKVSEWLNSQSQTTTAERGVETALLIRERVETSENVMSAVDIPGEVSVASIPPMVTLWSGSIHQAPSHVVHTWKGGEEGSLSTPSLSREVPPLKAQAWRNEAEIRPTTLLSYHAVPARTMHPCSGEGEIRPPTLFMSQAVPTQIEQA